MVQKGMGLQRSSEARELQKCLKKQPQLIYKSVEQRMLEDWEDAGSPRPGISQSNMTARGWLEHRSCIQQFPASIRSGWAIAGILDCLRGGRVEEARARACLALAQLDQQAIDRGNFLLASELSLESALPYSAFSGHSLPETWEAPHSKLVDPRWMDLFMHRLREVADFQEKKLKLSGARKQEDAADKTRSLLDLQARGMEKGRMEKETRGSGILPLPPRL